MDLLHFKNVSNHANKKLECLFVKLIPEMKATKFKKYESAVNSLKHEKKEIENLSAEV